jgi:hypothetical protein
MREGDCLRIDEMQDEMKRRSKRVKKRKSGKDKRKLTGLTKKLGGMNQNREETPFQPMSMWKLVCRPGAHGEIHY